MSFGPDDQRAGDGDALALAAGELVDVLLGILGAEPDILQRLGHRRAPRGAARRRVEEVEGLGHQPRHAVAGVEAAIGVLEHRLHLGAQAARHPLAGRHRLALDPDAAALHRLEPEDGAAEGRLAAAALADEPEALARVRARS